MLSSTVVTNPRVPRLIRHSLNLESGLNDGLALPAVLAFTAAAESDGDFVWWRFVLQDVTVGVLTGLVVAFVAVAADAAQRELESDVGPHQKALYALGVAFAAYGAATLPPEGNGFIAVFVCAIAFGIMRPDIRDCFEARSEDLIEVVKLGVFLVFGSILTLDGLFAGRLGRGGHRALHPARGAPDRGLRRAGGNQQAWTRPAKAFMAWFGPKGVATMTFALFVLGSAVPDAERILNLAALTVFAVGHRPRADGPSRGGVDGAPASESVATA